MFGSEQASLIWQVTWYCSSLSEIKQIWRASVDEVITDYSAEEQIYWQKNKSQTCGGLFRSTYDKLLQKYIQ